MGYIFSIEFSLRIPQRVQDDIVRKISPYGDHWTGLGTEQFLVKTRYFFHGPVTVVECLHIDDNTHEDPSDAVFIVREYLQQKLSESSTDIQLECVGPSPFHVDFFAFDTDDIERPHVEYTEQRGYNIANVYIPTHVSANHISWLLDWMGDHLSFYYFLKRLDIRQGKQWIRIDKARHDLDESTNPGVYSNNIRAFMNRRRTIAKLVADILRFRAEMLSNRQFAFSAKKKIGIENDNLEFLDEKLDNALEETFVTYPTSEVLQLAKFYEERDSKWQDRIYFVLAALIGGVIGAILSQWLAG